MHETSLPDGSHESNYQVRLGGSSIHGYSIPKLEVVYLRGLYTHTQS
jgi:hypothetical protein